MRFYGILLNLASYVLTNALNSILKHSRRISVEICFSIGEYSFFLFVLACCAT